MRAVSGFIRPAFLAVVLALLAMKPAMALNIAVKGVVESNCFVSVSVGDATLSADGGGNVMLGDLGEHCNESSGYTVVLSSNNGGALVDANGNKIPYTISYDQVDSRPLSEPQVINRLDPQTEMRTGSILLTLPRQVVHRGGFYSDTLTITVRAR
ncbi:hypothetical protein [Nitrospirillum pindoramense]|uniref:Spore coat protein U-like protein n=1 Tax=Nitrospirillum amazonense TaxID=28077 RepID=A0A560HDK6_9PROT|nr:hypothetical protein [Nitrospirillum amazonense]TWB44483.1 hypothetical protein FBZ90_103391 [Nitrospirillum amazonense]